MVKLLWQRRVGRETMRLTTLGQVRDPTRGLRDSAWRRGANIVHRLGVDGALLAIDARAERALLAHRIVAACRWRELMTAIHAMSEDERQPYDRDH